MGEIVKRLTESEFKKVVENTVKRIVEEKNKEAKTPIVENKNINENAAANAIAMGVAATGVVSMAVKSIVGYFKQFKVEYPEKSTKELLLMSLGKVSEDIQRMK